MGPARIALLVLAHHPDAHHQLVSSSDEEEAQRYSDIIRDPQDAAYFETFERIGASYEKIRTLATRLHDEAFAAGNQLLECVACALDDAGDLYLDKICEIEQDLLTKDINLTLPRIGVCLAREARALPELLEIFESLSSKEPRAVEPNILQTLHEGIENSSEFTREILSKAYQDGKACMESAVGVWVSSGRVPPACASYFFIRDGGVPTVVVRRAGSADERLIVPVGPVDVRTASTSPWSRHYVDESRVPRCLLALESAHEILFAGTFHETTTGKPSAEAPEDEEDAPSTKERLNARAKKWFGASQRFAMGRAQRLGGARLAVELLRDTFLLGRGDFFGALIEVQEAGKIARQSRRESLPMLARRVQTKDASKLALRYEWDQALGLTVGTADSDSEDAEETTDCMEAVVERARQSLEGTARSRAATDDDLLMEESENGEEEEDQASLSSAFSHEWREKESAGEPVEPPTPVGLAPAAANALLARGLDYEVRELGSKEDFHLSSTRDTLICLRNARVSSETVSGASAPQLRLNDHGAAFFDRKVSLVEASQTRVELRRVSSHGKGVRVVVAPRFSDHNAFICSWTESTLVLKRGTRVLAAERIPLPSGPTSDLLCVVSGESGEVVVSRDGLVLLRHLFSEEGGDFRFALDPHGRSWIGVEGQHCVIEEFTVSSTQSAKGSLASEERLSFRGRRAPRLLAALFTPDNLEDLNGPFQTLMRAKRACAALSCIVKEDDPETWAARGLLRSIANEIFNFLQNDVVQVETNAFLTTCDADGIGYEELARGVQGLVKQWVDGTALGNTACLDSLVQVWRLCTDFATKPVKYAVVSHAIRRLVRLLQRCAGGSAELSRAAVWSEGLLQRLDPHRRWRGELEVQ